MTVAEPVTTHVVAAPRITFKDAAKAIEFYKQAFGARETFRFQIGSGIPHAEIMIGDSVVMLTEEWPEGGRFSAETLGESPVQFNIRVDDVDAFVAHAVAGGAKLMIPPTDQFYGKRDAGILDPFGYSWGISTVKEEMSTEEMHRRFNAMQAEPKKPKVSHIPEGYRTVTPYLVGADGPALVEFVKQAFDAEEKFRDVGSSGGLHAEVQLGDSRLMIGGGFPGKEFRSTPKTHGLHIYVEDCDAVYQKALAAGGSSIDEVRNQDYGERSGSVKDPAGNFWYIATSKGETYVPKGLNNVNAYLHPLRAEPVINFLKKTFGAREIAKYASPDGVVHHAEMQVGTAVVEMGESHGKYLPMRAMFYVYVPDCDAVYRGAIAAGATSLLEPSDKPYGDRTGAVKDAFGNEWHIATHIKDMRE